MKRRSYTHVSWGLFTLNRSCTALELRRCKTLINSRPFAWEMTDQASTSDGHEYDSI